MIPKEQKKKQTIYHLKRTGKQHQPHKKMIPKEQKKKQTIYQIVFFSNLIFLYF
jgi:hypothetical protein